MRVERPSSTEPGKVAKIFKCIGAHLCLVNMKNFEEIKKRFPCLCQRFTTFEGLLRSGIRVIMIKAPVTNIFGIYHYYVRSRSNLHRSPSTALYSSCFPPPNGLKCSHRYYETGIDVVSIRNIREREWAG
jgi:hypothetical protein